MKGRLGPEDRCHASVDGTDFRIQEPVQPRDPIWWSHKYNGPAVKYEICVGTTSRNIVWVNGPFPGARNDNRIFWEDGLADNLYEGERLIADAGYHDRPGEREVFEKINNKNDQDPKDRMISLIRSRHETVNRRFKEWGCLGKTFRHNVQDHARCFFAVANLVQLNNMMNDSVVWDVHFDESLWY